MIVPGNCPKKFVENYLNYNPWTKEALLHCLNTFYPIVIEIFQYEHIDGDAKHYILNGDWTSVHMIDGKQFTLRGIPENPLKTAIQHFNITLEDIL